MKSTLLYEYFTNLSPQQKEQFDQLEALYQDWNLKINVVSRKDIDELYLRHVLHSLGIAKVQELSTQLEIEDFKRNLHVQLENTLATYNNEKRLVDLTNGLVANAQRNLQIADERFKGGLINSFDFRTIQISYINAAQSRLNAIFGSNA